MEEDAASRSFYFGQCCGYDVYRYGVRDLSARIGYAESYVSWETGL